MSEHSSVGILTKAHRVGVVAGLRTPFAKQSTFYKDITALELGKLVVNELVVRNDIDPNWIEQLVFGQVLPSIEAPNIAREIVLGTPLNKSTEAYSVSRACATSFQAVANVMDSILLGNISAGIAGGSDSSSIVPITISKRLSGVLLDLSKAKNLNQKIACIKKLKISDLAPVPPAVKEFSTGLTMGEHAEQMAKDHNISRISQDEFAHRSHSLAAVAWSSGKLDNEVMHVYAPPFVNAHTKDNIVRFDSELESYSKLKPAFDKYNGTLTAANSSSLTDGAAAVILMSEERIKELDLKPLGWIRSYAFAALDPQKDMLLGPSYASPIALKRANLSLSDMTLIDMHEAFAAQVLCNIKAFESLSFAKECLNLSSKIGNIDMDKFNVLGGSIAYGHPFAATGARMITQTLRELKRRGGGFALTAACAAGGLGSAMILEVDE